MANGRYVKVKKTKKAGPAGQGTVLDLTTRKTSGFRGQQREQDRKVRRARNKAPGTAVPVKRFPTPQNDKQRKVVVRETQKALKGLSPQEKARLLRSGDDVTRQQLRLAFRAQRDLTHNLNVKWGLGYVTRDPKTYGATPAQAKALRTAAGKNQLPDAVRDQLAEIAKAAAGPQAVARAGRGKQKTVGAGFATINLTPTLNKLNDTAFSGSAGQAGKRFATGAGTVAGNVGKDALYLIPNAGRGVYEVGAAGVEAAQGRTGRGERLARSLDDGVVGQAAQGGYHAVTGDSAAAKENFDAALKQLSEHPLNSFLEVSGVGSGTGRVAGFGLRRGLGGSAGKRFAATARDPLTLVPGSNQQINRSYSRNIFVNRGQKALDARAVKRGQDPNVAIDGVFNQRSRALNSAVDEFSTQSEGIRRRGREEVARGAQGLAPSRGNLKRAGVERDVVMAAAEGRLRGPRSFVKDLKAERDRLDGAYQENGKAWSRSARLANREQVKAIDKTLNDPKALANADEVFGAADEYKAAADGIEAKLLEQNALDSDQALISKVRPFAVSQLGAKAVAPMIEQGRRAVAETRAARDAARRAGDIPELRRLTKQYVTQNGVLKQLEQTKTGLLDADNKPLSTDRILQAIRDDEHLGGKGELKLPAFVSQRRDQAGAKSFFVNWFDGRKTTDAKTRTGAASEKGAYDSSFKALGEGLVRQQGIVDAIDNFDRFVHQFGQKAPDGKHFTFKQAEKAADEYKAAGVEMTPVRVAPARYDAATKSRILEGQDAGRLDTSGDPILAERISAATKADPLDKGDANVVLVPSQQITRFKDHQLAKSNVGEKAFQALTGAFRGTVLSLSPKWVTGNVVEAMLRSVIDGVTPVDVVRGRKLLKELKRQDEKAWREMDTRAGGGLLFGSSDKLSIHRMSDDFDDSILTTPAKSLALARRMPVMKQIIDGVMLYQKAIFGLNRGMERAFQSGVIGKQARRDIEEHTGSWIKAVRMQHDAVKDLASGLIETPAQVKYARQVDATLGQYSRFSPTTRRIIQTYAPFLPWYLNSVKFVAYTLPVKHPLATSVLASATQTLRADMQAQAEELKGMNIDEGALLHAVKTKDGGYLDISRYTPFGAFTEGPAAIADPLLPQISSALNILRGKNFTGRDLQLANGSKPDGGKRAALALYSVAESIVPAVSIARRLQEEGGTAYDDSTVWGPKNKESKGDSAVRRVFDPFRPTRLGASVDPRWEKIGKGFKSSSSFSSKDEDRWKKIGESFK